MDSGNNEIQTMTLYARTGYLSGSTLGYGFVWADGSLRASPEHDFYIPLFLTKTGALIDGYVDIQSDQKTYTVERQTFNPFYIEMGFFSSISRMTVCEGVHITPNMKQLIRLQMSDKTTVESFSITSLSENSHEPLGSPYYKNVVVSLPVGSTTIATTTDFVQLNGTPYTGLYSINQIIRDGTNIKFLISGLHLNSPIPESMSPAWSAQTFPGSEVQVVNLIPGTDDEIVTWFDSVGKNAIELNEINGTVGLTLDQLDQADQIWTDIVSKAQIFNITINK